MAESPQMADWIAKEDDFQLKQAQKQAEIQVREKRAKPIDLLALNLTWENREDEDDGVGLECVCNDALSQLQNERTLHHDALTAVAAKLIELESNIEVKLAGDKPIDPEYWDSLLVQLNVWKAKAKLKGMHKAVLDEAHSSVSIKRLPQGNLQRNETHEAKNEDTTGIKIINKRQMVLNTRFVSKVKPNMNPQDQEILDQDALAEKLYAQEAEKRLAEAEEVFELEAKTGRQSYNWEDKHRPHKPCYFYNQTHYNTDNPPPKVVQGYKFNIFYPNLIDKTRATTYKIIKNKENEDIATL
ncbi:cactus-binding C-terminus of cactin protein-domain-containing protein [Phakopsora pachyrhizi]|nr:cactus-binding C-terminus of cactin protein-domain-containing protein [Phakopsora pachyrhizi]